MCVVCSVGIAEIRQNERGRGRFSLLSLLKKKRYILIYSVRACVFLNSDLEYEIQIVELEWSK